MKNTLTGYELSRAWFDFSFENPEKIKPAHTAIYFFIIEHCNRLGWKSKFGLPTTMAMEATGIKSYNTYISALKDIVKWEFITMVEKSKNQYSSNIIALSKYNKAQDKALDKAFTKHAPKQSESTVQSIDSIDKPINHKPINQQQQADAVGIHNLKTYNAFVDEVKQGYHQQWAEATYMRLKLKTGSLTPLLADFKNDLIRNETTHSTIQKLKHHLNNWLNRQNQIGNLNPYKLKAVGSI